MKKYRAIGLMSGTSLDGLDIAYCEFEKNREWKYKIRYAETKKYSREWKSRLNAAYNKDRKELSDIDKKFGSFLGKETARFIREKKISPDLISSHGHTVFHRPDKGITVQIGDGKTISSIGKLPVVCDFRSGDVALGGQGAPLVPIADKLLFSRYKYCLNLGGIANISFDDPKGKRIAFDICPANMVLNALSRKLGKEFDRGGRMASKGKVDTALLKKLNRLAFYESSPPKSLGREWVEKSFFPILDKHRASVRDTIRTVCEHIAVQIASVVNSEKTSGNSGMLVTGGGAYNQFLVKRIASLSKAKVVLPDDQTIQFKEAMAFAFLGVLRIRNEINILKSVTGAKQDSSGGTICRE